MTGTIEVPPAPLDPGVPGVLEAMRRQVRELAETLWAARTAQELAHTVTSIEALKSTLEALELDVIAELEATAGVRDEGWASTRDFVTAVAGGHHGTGPRLVRLAEDLATDLFIPVAAGMRDGWLSSAKAVAITRAVDALPSTSDRPRAVRLMLEEAKRLNASELAKAGRHLLSVIDPERDDRQQERELDREDRAAHLYRFLSVTDDHAGGAWIRGRCAAEDAALIKASLMSLAAPVPTVCDPETCRIPGCGHDGRDPRDHGARLLDALAETCRRAQTADLLPHQHGAPPRLTLLMNYTDLLMGLGVGVTEDGAEIPARAVRRLCCDAEVIPAVLGSTGEVLDVGRSSRLVTPGIWKALVARDRHCRFPGCRRPPLMCHAHHVEHWIDGGHTSLDNLLLLCGHHHRLVHAGPWQVGLDATGDAVFRPPPGTTRDRLITPRPPPRE
jgi:Domain of unknown function (DUF222)